MKAWPHGYGRRVFEEIDSTLNEAARIAPTLAGPEWIMAYHQTAGRGRRGRVWKNPRGNFSSTLVLRPDGPPEQDALPREVTDILAEIRATRVEIAQATEKLARLEKQLRRTLLS